MKHISKGYTLLESLVVLGIVAGLFLISSRMPVSAPNMSQWSATFKSSWQQERISAQTQQCRRTVRFRENGIVFNHTQLAYPKGYHHDKTQTIQILPTGYVAPTSVILSNGQHVIKIIFSLGGGAYRITQS